MPVSTLPSLASVLTEDVKAKIAAKTYTMAEVEATKGKVIRGQWYYATDEAAQSYVWFHSVQQLVARAIADDGVDYADLGPSGTDAFSELKERYGFASVADWHKVADYRGRFRYAFGEGTDWSELDPPDWLFSDDPFSKMVAKIS